MRHQLNNVVFGVILLAMLAISGCEDNAESDHFGEVPDVGPITVTPAEVTLDTNDTYAAFYAEGGSPPYRWQVSDTSLGTLSNTCSGAGCEPGAGASAITYTRVSGKYGVNVISVYDEQDWGGSALVHQTGPADTSTQ
jgi:hypothetical protein